MNSRFQPLEDPATGGKARRCGVRLQRWFLPITLHDRRLTSTRLAPNLIDNFTLNPHFFLCLPLIIRSTSTIFAITVGCSLGVPSTFRFGQYHCREVLITSGRDPPVTKLPLPFCSRSLISSIKSLANTNNFAYFRRWRQPKIAPRCSSSSFTMQQIYLQRSVT